MTGKSSLPRLAAESCRMKPVRERYSTLTVGRVAGSGLGARTGALTGAVAAKEVGRSWRRKLVRAEGAAAVRSAAFLRAIAAAAAGPSAATASTIQVRSRKCIAQLASVDAAQCNPQ